MRLLTSNLLVLVIILSGIFLITEGFFQHMQNIKSNHKKNTGLESELLNVVGGPRERVYCLQKCKATDTKDWGKYDLRIQREQFIVKSIGSFIPMWIFAGRSKAIAASLAGSKKVGGAEWGVALPPDWKITKKMDSTVRIKGETVLVAQEPSLKAELKINKVPLGRGAATNFSPMDQLMLAEYFSSNNERKIKKEDIVRVMERSLQVQTSSPQSALKGFSMIQDSSSQYIDGAGHRYVVYAYEADRCAGPLDYDGYCEDGLIKRKQIAVVTVGLELQARTLQEKRLMEAGEMERREIDVLWICSISAPLKKFNGNVGELLQDIVQSFEIDPITSI